MNYRPMVEVNGREWCSNALVFATKEEAEGNAVALSHRWLVVTNTRADETTDPVNYRWINGELLKIVENTEANTTSPI